MTTQHNQVMFDYSQQRDRMMRGMDRVESFVQTLAITAGVIGSSDNNSKYPGLPLVMIIVDLVRIYSKTS